MIEVNLHPGGKQKRRRASPGLSLPKFSVPGDPWTVSAIVVGVVAVAAMGYLFFDVRGAREEAAVTLQQAQQDSARYADLIARTRALEARRDTILQKVAVIEEIDAGRYVWPHILDEVSTALPDYTWLRQITQVSFGAGNIRLQVRGLAGNNFALARFMSQLEASPFLADVRIIQTILGRSNEVNQMVYSFDLEVSYEPPPPEFIQTVPLLEGEAIDPGGTPSGL